MQKFLRSYSELDSFLGRHIFPGSGLMATSLPGPGTILTGLEVRFSEAVTFPATIEVRVEVRGRVRRITRAAFRFAVSVHGI